MPQALTKLSVSGFETVLLFLSHLKAGGVCCEECRKTCRTPSPKEKSWPRSTLAGTVSILIMSGITGQPRMLLQGSGKDGQQLYVLGTECTKGLHPGWGEIRYPLLAPLISLGEGISAFLFSSSNAISTRCCLKVKVTNPAPPFPFPPQTPEAVFPLPLLSVPRLHPPEMEGHFS